MKSMPCAHDRVLRQVASYVVYGLINGHYPDVLLGVVGQARDGIQRQNRFGARYKKL